MRKRKKRIIGFTVATILIAIIAFLGFWFFLDFYGNFYEVCQKEFLIADLNQGFTPQGICHDETTDKFLTSGYMNNGSPSRIYVTDGTSGQTIKYFTLIKNDEAYTGHAGGIETDGTFVWVVGDGYLYTFSFDSISSVENGGAVEIASSFKTNNGADFVTIYQNNLWVGEFHNSKYSTDSLHHIGENKALSFCYEINHSGEHGLNSTTPIMALSTPSIIQGMVITENKIYTSNSYHLAKSHIYTFDNVLKNSTSLTFEYLDTEIPLYLLTNDNLTNTLTAPAMSEEITLVNNKIYILFENACQKYKLFTREELTNVYSFEIEL